MAVSTDPAVNKNGPTSNLNGASTSDNNFSNCGRSAVPENSAVRPSDSGLRHNVEIALQWTSDEQSLLEELLAKYSSESKQQLYAMIADQLPDKCFRDVAIRCRWIMMKEREKENGKRRREDNGSTRKQKDKKEKFVEKQVKPSSNATIRVNGLPYAQVSTSMESGDNMSYKVFGGLTGKLLEQNAQTLDQISANISAGKVHENINLFLQARNNIININELNNKSAEMKQMPPLPVKLNDELLSSLLPSSSMPR